MRDHDLKQESDSSRLLAEFFSKFPKQRLRLRVLFFIEVGVWISEFQIPFPDFATLPDLPPQILPPVGEWFFESMIRCPVFARRILPPVGEWFSESKIRCPDPWEYNFGARLLHPFGVTCPPLPLRQSSVEILWRRVLLPLLAVAGRCYRAQRTLITNVVLGSRCRRCNFFLFLMSDDGGTVRQTEQSSTSDSVYVSQPA